MAKRKKEAMEPRDNDDLPPHSHPSTSTPERKRRKPRDPALDAGSGSDSDSSPPSTPDSVRRLIEPYSKPRLLAILAEAASSDPALRARLLAAADASPSHRRLFVHGLPPHADGAALAEAFSRFGPLVDCHAVADRATGRCKGYGFVSFASRAAALRALRCTPRVSVFGRPVSAQFASAGPDPSGFGGGATGRRVYVTNVAPDASAERLRAFFARFGELEGGPFGFDAETGRSRGYALFVYREAGGAAKAVEEPYRVFEGRTLQCQLANDPARKSKAPAPAATASAAVTPPPPVPAVEAPALQPVLDAIVAGGVRDLTMYARNPAQAAALLGQNPILAAATLTSALASAAAAARSSVASGIAPRSAAAPAPTPVTVPSPRPATATAAAMVPSPVKVGVRPSSGAGLLGPYKPPSSPVVSSSSGRKGTMLGT
ncbi:RNA-binding protein P-like [Phragmites australis]|uniref:RNA-binding protein P-like n=1 Tax=Phragmites australis TaxID=29695 RepID=UPI002D79D85B|nr:RNA-binding protein P-like [Phragmites australis]